ncbi:glycolate oxidase FAD binding subunit [Rhizobiales bacterium GAS113]|jgi:glycolate oxidase FAD binding subunit|nr:glycolate oxidase FAD binding subunit [Rhizobiales bacterium GAS113]
MTTHAPASEAEAQAIIADAGARHAPLSIEGGGTKRGIGRPTQTQDVLSSLALSGITLHEPAELVIAARAGTPLAEVERALAAKGQRLPFEPLDYRKLLGTNGEPTIGGMAAANLSGPRRIQAGACRDSFLGVRFVNGRGESVKSGGRVMKNVTGLDLTRLMAGAFGTLGFLTEVTFKVLPLPQTQATLVLSGLSDVRGVEALSAGLGSPFEVTGAAHLPAGIGEERARTLLRLESSTVAVAYRSERLTALLQPFGLAEILSPEASEALWLDVRDAVFLAEPREAAIWRLSAAPSCGPGLAEAIGRKLEARCFYDWGGGLVWLACPALGDAGASIVHAASRAAGGHATLIRAPDAVRAAVDVFQPPTAALLKLTRDIKASFDPAGLLEPGRMYAGL